MVMGVYHIAIELFVHHIHLLHQIEKDMKHRKPEAPGQVLHLIQKIVGHMAEWLRAQTLPLENLGVIFESIPRELCDLRTPINLSVPQFLQL